MGCALSLDRRQLCECPCGALSGRVKQVHVVDNQHVVAGELLLTLDKRSFTIAADMANASLAATDESVAAAGAAVDTARARLTEAQAAVDDSATNARRLRDLLLRDDVARADVDKAETAVKSSQAASPRRRDSHAEPASN